MADFSTLPSPPTNKPVILDESEKLKLIQDTLTNMWVVSKFANYMWNKYCKPSGASCLDAQKKHIEKYLLWTSKTAPQQEQIIYDMMNFATSRGSNIYHEFTEWIKSMSSNEFRLLQLRKGGGKTRKYRGRNMRKRSRKH
jgi:hypothetical protein